MLSLFSLKSVGGGGKEKEPRPVLYVTRKKKKNLFDSVR